MGLTKAERHNRMMDKIFDNYHRTEAEIKRLWETNPHLTEAEARATYWALENMPTA